MARVFVASCRYAISFVFKGDFGKRVRAFPKGVRSNTADDVPALAEAVGVLGVDADGNRDVALDELYFLGVDSSFDGKYTLEIEEDETAGLGIAAKSGPLVLAENPNAVECHRGTRQEGCSCLYGNPCQDKYVCQNWANRLDVAKKNGWKGY